FVPGATGLLPNAPPVAVDGRGPIPRPWLSAAVEKPRASAKESGRHCARQRTGNFFIVFFMAGSLRLPANNDRSSPKVPPHTPFWAGPAMLELPTIGIFQRLRG